MSVPFVQAIEEASPSLTCTCTHVYVTENMGLGTLGV